MQVAVSSPIQSPREDASRYSKMAWGGVEKEEEEVRDRISDVGGF